MWSLGGRASTFSVGGNHWIMIGANFIFESCVEDLLEGLDLVRAVKLVVFLLYEPKGDGYLQIG